MCFFLTRMPSPKIIFQAFTEVKPNLIVAVPLIIEKIIKKSVLPKLETPAMKLLLKVPIINDKIKATVREQMIQAFGGNFAEIIVGGAAFNQEVEQFLKMIDFPYTVGYGMTECGPIICYEDWTRFKPGSCGKAAPRMEVKILSSDPENIPGEIVCRGPNVRKDNYPPMHFHLNREKRNQEKEKYIKNEDKKKTILTAAILMAAVCFCRHRIRVRVSIFPFGKIYVRSRMTVRRRPMSISVCFLR